jgi:hypothetical protein
MATLREEYAARLARAERSARTTGRLHAAAGWLRLLLSVLVVVAIVSAYDGRIAAGLILVPAAGVVAVFAAEVVLQRLREKATRTAALYASGLARLDERWEPVPFTGAEFVPPDHPAALDLDLVGERSLFAWLSTARTRPGAQVLATWLIHPADGATLRTRGEAIDELRGRIDLWEAVHLAGGPGVARVDAEAVGTWCRGASLLPWTWMRWPLAGLAWGLVAAGAGAVLGWWGSVPPVAIGFAVILAHLLLGARASAVAVDVVAPLRQLSVVAGVMAVLERQEFEAPLLRSLQEVLLEGGKASSAVARLARIVGWLEELKLGMVKLVGLPLLWPARKGLAVESWRRAHGNRLQAWLEAVGAFEALLSIATYADEHPTHVRAEVVPEGPVLEARGLGHPLLPATSCVPNDVSLGDPGAALLLLSGSNMSGKSTLLRAVGLNAAMALAGVPVRASGLRLSRMAVAASIRTHDSVLDGESRFYAEIKRLKAVVDLTRGPIPVLFLLDEILGGTNSHDRLAGATGILSALVARGGIGICSTHDLALTRIADGLGSQGRNAHFGDALDAGRLAFDYKLKPGIVEHTNALELMRAVGLEV